MVFFRKSEKLCRKKIIDQLFVEGRSFTLFPIRVQFLTTPSAETEPVQAMFTVPKRRFKLAVKRNLLKRRMRESYRQHKWILRSVVSEERGHLAVAFIYLANREFDFHALDEVMQKAIDRVKNELERSS